MVLIFANDVLAFNEQVEHFINKHIDGVLQEAKLTTSYNLDTAIGEATLKHYNDLILKNDLGEFDLAPFQEKQLIRKAAEYFKENQNLYTVENQKKNKIVPFESLEGIFRDEYVKLFIAHDSRGNFYKSKDQGNEPWERISNEHYNHLSDELKSKPLAFEKMKGEINGEFEALYVAKDLSGQLYKSHDLQTTWQKMSAEEYNKFKSHLHTLPFEIPITIENSKTKTITTMAEKNENEKTFDVELLSGYIGKDGVKSEIVEKNNTLVANFSIGSGPRDKTVWTQVEAWGPVAEKIKDLPKGAKVTISGNIRDASYVNKDGKDVKKEVLTAKEISLHELQELKGTVDSIKQTDKYIDIKLYVNNGGEKADLHNLRVFGDERAKFENVKEKDVLSLTGDVQFREYTKDNEVKTALNTVCKTLHSVTPHAEKGAAVENKKETKVEAAAAEGKAPKKAGKKDKGVSM